MLHVRSSIYKILLVFAVMAASEAFFFSTHLNKIMSSDSSEDKIRLGLGCILEDSRIHFLFLAAFLLISIILLSQGFDFKEKTVYTIRRLSIPEKQYFLLQGLYYTLVYLLLFCVQILLVYLLGRYYFITVPENNYSNQTFFLIFYSNQFLHSLLPLEETVRGVRNVIMIFALGYSNAYQSYTHRRGKKQGMFLILSIFVILNFQSSLGSFVGDTLIIAASCTVLCFIGYSMLKRGNDHAV